MFGSGKAPLVLEIGKNGRASFVGRVPLTLAYQRRDGQPMTRDDWRRLDGANTPWLLGYGKRVFDSEADAVAAAAEIGAEITQIDRGFA